MLLFLCALISSAFCHLNRKIAPDPIFLQLIAQNNLTIYEECSYFSGDCFVIKDFVNSFNGQIFAHRHLKPKMNMLGSITIARLSVPSTITSENLSTRSWQVDKTIIEPSFPTGMLYIAIGYVMEVLSFEAKEKQKILMIGLGGGTISNYLSTTSNIYTTVVELDPVIVRIAEKYFSHSDVKGMTTTYIEDGVKFLRRSAGENKKYRIIMVDADYNGDTTGTGLIGPVKEFIKRETVESILKSLDSDGIVAVNVVSVHSRESNEKQTISIYKEFFPSCFYVSFFTKLLICSKKMHWTFQENHQLFRKNLKTAIARLGFKELENVLDF